jgi:hypothetical protein
VDEPAQADKVAYVLGNPVGLVKKAADWPGATALHSIVSGAPLVTTLINGLSGLVVLVVALLYVL